MPSAVPFRVVLTHKGISRKFFSLFEGKDGSLYIHPNRENGKPWKTPSLTQNDNGMALDFNNTHTPEFEPHKISFHPSGYIHITNKNGERYQDGTRGPTFDEMDSPYLFCIIVPRKLEEMPIFKNDKKCMLVNFAVPDNILPFYITLALLKGKLEDEVSDECRITPRFILPLKSGYKLTFLLRSVKQRDKTTLVNWPPFPFCLLRNAA